MASNTAENTGEHAGSVQSAVNTLRILEEVATRQPVGVSELSKATEIPKSSVQRFVLTLHQAGWLHQVGHEMTRWTLTSKALTVGLSARPELSLREAALPVMQHLREETNETVHLAIRDGSTLLITERLDSTQPVRTFVPLGTHAPMHATASGRAVLAQLPDQEVTNIIDLGLPRYTEQTLVEPAKLHQEIDATRQRGYAINICGWRPHVGAVACAVVDPARRPVGALAISMPMVRCTEPQVSTHGDLAIQAVHSIGQSLHGGWAGDPY